MKLPKVVVFGGHGFLGSEIVKQFPKNQFQVVSLSRSLPTNKVPNVDYVGNVDVFQPKTYNDHIKDADHIIHSIGVIFPNESYKKIVNSKSPCQLVGSVFDFFLPQKNSATIRTANAGYDKYNYESLKTLADSYVSLLKTAPSRATTPSFTYISAEETPMVRTLVPSGYITSKRKSELHLLHYEKYLKPIVVRPGFMFDAKTNEITPRSTLACVLKNTNPFSNKFMCSTQDVAKTIVNKIQDQTYNGGIITLEKI